VGKFGVADVELPQFPQAPQDGGGVGGPAAQPPAGGDSLEQFDVRPADVAALGEGSGGEQGEVLLVVAAVEAGRCQRDLAVAPRAERQIVVQCDLCGAGVQVVEAVVARGGDQEVQVDLCGGGETDCAVGEVLDARAGLGERRVVDGVGHAMGSYTGIASLTE